VSAWSEALATIRRPALILVALVVLFVAARAALLLIYPDHFRTLSPGQILTAFIRGLTFDLSIILHATLPPLVLMILPFGWARSATWQGVCGWLCYATFVVFAFVHIADLVSFGFVHRHMGPEVWTATDDFHDVAALVLMNYWWALSAFVLGAVGLGLLWRRMLGALPPVRYPVRIGALVIIVALPMFVGARGRLDGRRIRPTEAFHGVTQPEAYLSLNAPLSVFHHLQKPPMVDVDYFPWEEALATAQSLYVAPGEAVSDPEYPFLRKPAVTGRKRLNVVIILLESVSAIASDAFRRELGMELMGITPRLDALCREGVKFPNLYATGQKSRSGRGAVMTMFPTFPGLPLFGRGLEEARVQYIGRLAQREGYETYMLQGAERFSMNGDTLSLLSGFDHYMGAEDIRRALGKDEALSAPDVDTFEVAHRKLQEATGPFFAYIHTTSSHAPYVWEGEEFELFPDDSQEHRYWNSIAYLDHALGGFIDKTKQAGYFSETVFIIAADHTGKFMNDSSDPRALFHIPGLVIAPGLQPGVDGRVGSLLDIIPTAIDLAGWQKPHASFGRFLVDPASAQTSAAMASYGDLALRVERDAWMVHDLERRVKSWRRHDGVDLDAVERRLLSTIQVGVTLLQRNRIIPSSEHEIPGQTRR
jgi:hypothetical protein